MLAGNRQQDYEANSLTTKATYSKAEHKKLVETRAKLAGVNAKITCAINSGEIAPSERLDRARRAIDVGLAIAEVRLDQLRKSGEDDWMNVSVEVESAWEELSRSIKRLVSTISE